MLSPNNLAQDVPIEVMTLPCPEPLDTDKLQELFAQGWVIQAVCDFQGTDRQFYHLVRYPPADQTYHASVAKFGISAGGVLEFLAIAPPQDERVTVGAFAFYVTSETLVELYEGPEVTNNGEALPEFNLDRNSSKTAATKCFDSPVIGAPGTRLAVSVAGPGNNESAGSNMILRRGESYLLRLTNQATGNASMSAGLYWSERPFVEA